MASRRIALVLDIRPGNSCFRTTIDSIFAAQQFNFSNTKTMKKILLILALAVMASAPSMANARTLNGNPRGNDVVITDPNVRMTYTSSTITIRLYAGLASWISIENWNTGEIHSLTLCPSRGGITVPVSKIAGTWEVKGYYDNGEPFYGRFFIDNTNPDHHLPVNWFQTENPFDGFGGLLEP